MPVHLSEKTGVLHGDGQGVHRASARRRRVRRQQARAAPTCMPLPHPPAGAVSEDRRVDACCPNFAWQEVHLAQMLLRKGPLESRAVRAGPEEMLLLELAVLAMVQQYVEIVTLDIL